MLIATSFAFIRASRRSLALFAAAWLAASAAASVLAPGAAASDVLFAHLFQYTPFFTGGVGFFLWRTGARDMVTTAVIGVSGALAVTRLEVFGPAALVLFGVFFLVVSDRLKILAAPPLLYLGRISYPLYLFHLAPGFLIVNALDKAGASPVVSVGAALAVIVTCAHVIHVLIEAPARRRLRRLARPRAISADAGALAA